MELIQGFIVILFFGLIFELIFKKFKLPGLLGLIFVGIITGPYGLNLIDKTTLGISGELRTIALVIILIRAGLGIKYTDIKSVGILALLLSIIPVLVEGTVVTVLSHYLLGLPIIEAGMLGFIVAAVSPAVIVPKMLDYIERGVGDCRKIPTMILASASVDDILAITFFYIFVGLFENNDANKFTQVLNIPISVTTALAIGITLGLALTFAFKKLHLTPLSKAIIIFCSSLFLLLLEKTIEPYIAMASLLGIMTLSFIIRQQDNKTTTTVTPIFKNVWVVASIFLFVLVGAKVDPQAIITAGFIGVLIIFVGLIARSITVYLCTIKSGFTKKEQLFCIIAFLPKATVQAAIGAIPLSIGATHGDIILAIAVMSIIITAPLGAILLQVFGESLLTSDTSNPHAT